MKRNDYGNGVLGVILTILEPIIIYLGSFIVVIALAIIFVLLYS